MKIAEYIFFFMIFPGFAFSAGMGMIVGWVDRFVTARIQWRVGPPWYQNFIDVAKLILYKETLIPEGASKSVMNWFIRSSSTRRLKSSGIFWR